MKAAWLITCMPLAACETVPTAEQFIPDYRGVQTQLLSDDLVQFDVEMTNADLNVHGRETVRILEQEERQYEVDSFGFTQPAHSAAPSSFLRDGPLLPPILC